MILQEAVATYLVGGVREWLFSSGLLGAGIIEFLKFITDVVRQ